jgi:DNA-binding PadR family transcriptional regulator
MNDYHELSFDCVLPSAIFFNEHLEPSCIKFYAIIRNLTKKHGYCYATNQHLESVLSCSTASIKRWLGSLEEQGYLEVETEKNGIHWQRRIYLSDKFKIELRRFKNEPPPAQKCTPPSSKMSPITEEYSKKEIIKEVVCPSGAVAPSESQKKVEKIGTDGNKRILEKDEVIRKMIHEVPEATMGEIEEAWKILVGYTGAVNDPMQFILGTVKNLKSKNNLEKLHSKEKKCPPTSQIPPVKALTLEEIASRQQHAQTLFSEYLTKP